MKNHRLLLTVLLGPSLLAVLAAQLWSPNALAFQTNQAAKVVIGQPNMFSHGPNQGMIPYENWRNPIKPTAQTLFWPGQLQVRDGKLFIADYYNSRVLTYNSVPTANNAKADIVVGQPDMFSNDRNQQPVGGPPWVPGEKTLYYPDGVFVSTDGRMLIADAFNNRCLVFNSLPPANNRPADVVVGQPAFTEYQPNQLKAHPEATTQYDPRQLFVHPDGRVFIADRINHRVLVYDSIPTFHNQSAALVVGQPDFWSNQTNQGLGHPGENTLLEPTAVFVDAAGRMYVTDTGNHRVLIFNTVPSNNNATADIVVGQPNFSSGEPNRGLGSCRADTLSEPFGMVYAAGDRLFVPDSDNHRVLIYKPIPTTNGAAAAIVLGQPDMTSNKVNQQLSRYDPLFEEDNPPTPTAKTLYWPDGVFLHRNQLLVADTNNNRVLIYEETGETGEPEYLEWSLPAGGTKIDGYDFATYILVSNPGDQPAAVEVKFVEENGPIPGGWFNHTIPARSRYTVKVNDVVGNNRPAVSTIVRSLNNVPIMCERAMYWDAGGVHWTGGHNSVGISPAAKVWNLPEGATHIFDEFIHVLNPGSKVSQVDAVFMDQAGFTWQTSSGVEAEGNWTIRVKDVVGSLTQVSTRVTGSEPVAVDRTMYWKDALNHWVGGHCSRGLADPDTQWFLAEGANHIFDHYVLVSNPSTDQTADVVFTFMDNTGNTAVHEKAVGPKSRYTVKVNDVTPGLIQSQISTRAQSSNGVHIFAERAMYWPKGGPSVWADGHDSVGIGINALAKKWYLPEGATHFFNQYVLVANPSSSRNANVKFTFMDAFSHQWSHQVVVPPMRRYTVNVNSEVGSVAQVSTVVESDIPVIAERAMYWPKGGSSGWHGGHGTVGIPGLEL